jgi:predicted nucleic acid-binding protein
MARFIDPLYTNNFLDANIFDEIADGQEAAVHEILRIYDDEHITLLLPYSVQAELEDPKTPEAVKKASQHFVYSIEVNLTGGEKELYQKLLAEVTGDSQPKNIARDLFHVFEAQKNGGGHFVTRDKRLLKRSDAIEALLHIEVLTPEDFVNKVREAQEREREFARHKEEQKRS